MLPKASRLTAQEVRAVLRAGRAVRAGAVSARYTKAAAAKAAVVVSAKTAPRAVERNRLRRAGYAALPSPLPQGHTVIFINSKDFSPGDIAALCSRLS